MGKLGNGRIFYALDDPRFEKGRMFFGEQHSSSNATIWESLYSERASTMSALFVCLLRG